MGKIMYKNNNYSGGSSDGFSGIELTQAEYDALSEEQKNNGLYFITDGDVTTGVDYIVEQGTSGIWTYRKWNSGIAECWTYSQITFDTANASSSGIEGFKVVSVEVPLPFDFLAYPSSTCSCAWSFTEWTECHCNEHRVLVRQICNTNSMNVATKYVTIQVKGFWK